MMSDLETSLQLFNDTRSPFKFKIAIPTVKPGSKPTIFQLCFLLTFKKESEMFPV